MTKTLCVIPARGGSKGIPLKNLAPLNGKPLLSYALKSALAANEVDRTVVSSDHAQILDYARGHGDGISLRRPENLARDDTPTAPVVLHALNSIERAESSQYDIAIVVQATMPFVTTDDIDATIRLLKSTGSDSCVTVVNVGHLHPQKLKRLEGNRLVPFLQEEITYQRQNLPPVYIRNSSCYAVKSEVLRAGSLYGEDTRAVVVPNSRYVDINEPMDLEFAEFLMQRTPPNK